jgi:endonuclease/exonuclease/phosphatase family metal-dependent hydrolase
VVLQEATTPAVVARIAAQTGLTTWASDPRHSVGFLSRVPVASHAWYRPTWSRRAFLEIVLAESGFRIFGVHLSAVHSNWTERLRVRELRSLLAGIQRHQHGPHAVTGDFNTLAPGEELDVDKLPLRLRPLIWVSGRQIRWQTIQLMLDAGYVDAYRLPHPREPGFTFPTWDPHVRLDYVFVPVRAARLVQRCDVVTGPEAAKGSDHFPLLAEIDVSGAPGDSLGPPAEEDSRP